MAVTCTGEGRVLRAAISGEVDHHRARAIMEELSRQIDLELPRSLTLDLEGVTFMDSSGIAVLLRAYRRLGAVSYTHLRARFAAQLDPTLDEVNDIKTAVSEAVTNCIVHAYPDRLGKVSMRLRLFKDNTLEIQVKDWGVGIADVEQARQPLYTTGTEERSGMGFTIMESFMDAVKVRSTPGKGTVVTLRRRVSRRMGAPV